MVPSSRIAVFAPLLFALQFVMNCGRARRHAALALPSQGEQSYTEVCAQDASPK
jgi:hypothetical protein